MARAPNPLDRIARLGAGVLAVLEGLGGFMRLVFQLLARLPATLRRPTLVAGQVHFLGNHSLAIILVSGLFVGLVLGLQGYYTLRRYGSEEALGLLVALSLVRELGPVITALLFAGRAGTSLTAEIGLMKAGEQLSALEAMAVDPVARILGPRFAGGVIAMPLLAAMFSAFGFTVTLVALYMGYSCRPTPEGVSRATTQTVVVGSLAILGLDFMLTALMFGAL
ncbi:MAG: ABC transporter permease [Burkholderiaceae bacterium]